MNNPEIAEEQKLLLFTKLCIALHQIHELKLKHLALKPENILVDKNGNLKIKWAFDNQVIRSNEVAGTYEYFASKVNKDETEEYSWN